MSLNYKINPELDIPIYRQLVDVIRAAIKKGELSAGQRLPTVQEMTAKLSVARGTVKRAYDELEIAGLIEKVQGRGTFVRYQPQNSGSRKEQAMAAIDGMLTSLEEMGFSAAEINIFLNLKLRERSKEESHVKVAVIECNPETLSQMSEQLRHISCVDLYSYMLENIKQYPYTVGEDFDLIVSTSTHAELLEEILPEKKKIARVALRPSPIFLSHIIKLRHNENMGIIGYSRRFGELIKYAAEAYTEDVSVCDPLVLESDGDIKEYLKDKDVVLTPKHYEKYFGAEGASELKKFKGEVIECFYEMDEGSLLYLENKIKRLLNDKAI